MLQIINLFYSENITIHDSSEGFALIKKILKKNIKKDYVIYSGSVITALFRNYFVFNNIISTSIIFINFNNNFIFVDLIYHNLNNQSFFSNFSLKNNSVGNS